jgi:Ca2+-transporting ATPase
MRFNITVMSIYFTISLLLLLWWFLSSGGEIDRVELSIIFSVFVMFQLFNEINCRSVDAKVSPLAGILKSKSFMGVFGSTVIIQILLVQVGGPVGDFFRTTPLDLTTWLLIIAFGSSALVLGEIGRFIRKGKLLLRQGVHK